MGLSWRSSFDTRRRKRRLAEQKKAAPAAPAAPPPPPTGHGKWDTIPDFANYVNRQQASYVAFQTSVQQQVQQQINAQRAQLQAQIAQIQQASNAAIAQQQQSLAKHYDQMRREMTAHRNQMAKDNAASFARVRDYESSIQALPGFTDSAVMDSVGTVQNPLEIFGNIGFSRKLGDTGRRAETGFSSAQQASMSRQNRGNSAFRIRRIES